jgi:oxygen-dependent protoporphyrinogen oxidase
MILIIGGGISGLSLAWELQQLQKPYLLLEQAPQTGGYIRSIREGPYLFEEGPNSLLADENLLEWIKGLGLEEELIEANPVSKNRYIYKKGRYRALPSSPQGLIWNSFFSLTAKWSILTEPYKKSHSTEGETLSAFFERRFCHEVVEYALDPFVAGIYAGSPSQLLISQTFPQLLDYEASYGSVLKGLARQGRSRKKTSALKMGSKPYPRPLHQN